MLTCRGKVLFATFGPKETVYPKMKIPHFYIFVVIFIHLEYFSVSCSILLISAVELYVLFSNIMELEGAFLVPLKAAKKTLDERNSICRFS